MSSNYTLYTDGVWTDYTDGRHILTLKKIPAGALQAAIPLFISLVGKFFWNFVRRLWYHIHFVRRHTTQPGHLAEQHYDVLLHNSSGGLSTSLTAAKLWRTWRRVSAPKIFRRFAPLAITAALYWALWTAASAVSFYVWQDRVTDLGLIRSLNCGIVGYNYTDYIGYSMSSGQSFMAENWVDQCYGDSPSNPGACDLYPRKSLDFVRRRDVPCPLRTGDLCVSVNSSSHEMDTGPIDSHYDLGVNAPPFNRVIYRKRTVCSPVRLAPYLQVLNASEVYQSSRWPNDTKVQRFLLGPLNKLNQSFTYQYNTAAASVSFGYQTSTFMYYARNQSTDDTLWLPNSTFWDRNDADLSLTFLASNTISYNATTYDPWFKADIQLNDSDIGDNLTWYTSTYYITALSCIDQFQICNPSRPEALACTPLVGWYQLDSAIKNHSLALNPVQMTTAERLALAGLETGTHIAVYARGADVLLAQRTVNDLFQYSTLPIDQWRAEVENWFAIGLAKLQRQVFDYAAGPFDPAMLPALQKPWSSDLADQCNSQMVKIPSGYVNFNFDAVMAIFIIGSLMISIGLLFEPILAWYLDRAGKEGQLAWTTNGPFQLQYHAYAGQGIKNWWETNEDIPTTINYVPRLHHLL